MMRQGCGPGWSAGEVGGDPTDPNAPTPVDNLDAAFKLHDIAYTGTSDTIIPQADFALLSTIDSFQFADPNAPSYGGDMEASLYAGFASLSIIGQLVITPGALEELAASGADISVLPQYTRDALQNMEAGLAAVPGEAKSLHGALHVFEAKFLPQLEASFDLLV